MLSYDEYDSTNKALPREEFSSHGGSVIDLGHFKNKTKRNTPYKQDMLMSNNVVGVDAVKSNNLSQGLNQTRFHKGFSRRQKANITNAVSEEQRQREESYAAVRDNRRQQNNAARMQFIREQDAKSGFNIINGMPKLQGPPVARPQGLKCGTLSGGIVNGLGPEAKQRGDVELRESRVGRYFAPFGSGSNHEHRQQVLYREGLLSEKGAGIISVGKRETHSYGIEDQFSKSEYTKNSESAKQGLYEARIPGKYTPRKIPNHPSGNSEIVQKWNTNIDLNNRTLANRP